jgi:hypothetical protein
MDVPNSGSAGASPYPVGYSISSEVAYIQRVTDESVFWFKFLPGGSIEERHRRV